jgi:hypothetical protein
MAEPDWQRWELVKPEPELIFDSVESLGLAAGHTPFLLSPVILPAGIQAEIDTSQCGFLTTPCYTARLSGTRVKQVTIELDERQIVVTVLLDGLVQLVEPSPDKFTIQVLLLAAVSETIPTAAFLRACEQFVVDWQLVWMGVEG